MKMNGKNDTKLYFHPQKRERHQTIFSSGKAGTTPNYIFIWKSGTDTKLYFLFLETIFYNDFIITKLMFVELKLKGLAGLLYSGL